MDRVRREAVERRLHARSRRVPAGAETLHPCVRVLDVDLLLGGEAAGQRRQPRVPGAGHAPEPMTVEVIAEELPGEGDRPVEIVRHLDDGRASERLGGATERQIVRPAIRPFADERIDGQGVGDLVLGDRREGDVLLEDGAEPRPVAVAVAEDELVVGGGQEEVGEGSLEIVGNVCHDGDGQKASVRSSFSYSSSAFASRMRSHFSRTDRLYPPARR